MKSSNIFTVHRILQDTNFKHEKSRVCKGSSFDFCKFVFYRCEMTGLIDFPEKRALTKVNYLLPLCQILWNITEGNARKVTFNFAFLCSWWRHKIWKNTDVLVYDQKIFGSSSKVFCNLRLNIRKFWRMFGNVRMAFGQVLANLRKSLESGRKSSENCQNNCL